MFKGSQDTNVRGGGSQEGTFSFSPPQNVVNNIPRQNLEEKAKEETKCGGGIRYE